MQRYQSFIAWRYMMARPRKWSKPIIVVTAVLFGAAIVLGLLGYFVLERPDPESVVPSAQM